MGAPRTAPKVLAALIEHKGQNVSADVLADETGLEPHQVQTAVRNLISRGGHSIVVVAKAHIWRYEGEAVDAAEEQTEDTSFELVGRTKSGVEIVRGDRTQILYTLEPIEFD